MASQSQWSDLNMGSDKRGTCACLTLPAAKERSNSRSSGDRQKC
jgi:hypothetical protein